MTWALAPVPPDDEELEAGPRRDAPLQCPCCGRFARWAGDRHYYNGSFSCYRFTVDCSRCGLQDVECV